MVCLFNKTFKRRISIQNLTFDDTSTLHSSLLFLHSMSLTHGYYNIQSVKTQYMKNGRAMLAPTVCGYVSEIFHSGKSTNFHGFFVMGCFPDKE